MASLFAVAAFFSISGFIIVVASLDNQGDPRSSQTEFVRRRFVRIVPFLWLCTIGYNLLSWAGTHQLEWGAALRTLVVWPLGELKPNVAWSLRHELLFYAIYAIALLGARRRPMLLVAWIGASALFYLASYDMGWAVGITDRPWFELLKVAMGGDHGANFQFAVGMGLAYLYLLRPGSLPLDRVSPLVMIALTAVACVVVSIWPLAYGLPVSLLWTAMAAPILASAVCARPGTGVLDKAGLVLGNASFAIYLVHNPIVLVLLAVAQKAHLALPTQGHLLAFLTFAVVVTVIGGIAVHYLVEAPLIRLCDRWTRKATTEPVAAAIN